MALYNNIIDSDSRMHSKKLQRQKSLLGKSKGNHDITLTPRDFNYDNHHYQYLKYSKRAKVSLFMINMVMIFDAEYTLIYIYSCNDSSCKRP